MDLRVLDKRVVERYVKDGTISREQYEKYLDGLPDVAHMVDDEASLRLVIPSKHRRKSKGAAKELDSSPSKDES